MGQTRHARQAPCGDSPGDSRGIPTEKPGKSRDISAKIPGGILKTEAFSTSRETAVVQRAPREVPREPGARPKTLRATLSDRRNRP